MSDLAELFIKVDSKGVVTASKSLEELEGKSRKVEKATDSVTKSFGALKSMMSGLAVYFSVREIMAFSSSLFEAGKAAAQLNKAYAEIQGSSALANKEFGFLRKAADDLGQNFYVLAEAYKGISAASKGTSLQGQATRDIFVAVTKAAASLGLSADATSGSLVAIQQMMSKGKVSAEELRQQLGERLPGAFNLMAEAMGVSTQKLDDMLQKGEVLASDALPKLANVLSKRYSGAVDEATRASNKFQEAWTDLKVEMAKSGFLDSVNNSLKNITDTLKDPEVQRSLKDFAANLGAVIEKLSGLAKYAGLRSIFGTMGQASELATKGLLDLSEFAKLGFVERQRLVDDILAKQKALNGSMSDSELERLLDETLKKTEDLTVKTIATAEATTKLTSEQKKAVAEAERIKKAQDDYVESLGKEIAMIGLDEAAKERLEAREKGLTGARLESVDAMIAQKYASLAAWKAAESASDAMEKNIADGEAMAIKGDADRVKKAIADAEKLLQDKMTLYKDLEGFENEYRDAQLEWIEKIRQEEIKAGLDKEAANKKAADSEARLAQDLFRDKTQYIADGFSDLDSAFAGISKLYSEGSDDAKKWQEASDAMMVAQKAVAVVNAVAAIANQGLGDPYTAFARIAAMAAAMGALLGSIGESVSGGSGSSGSATQSTATNHYGSVLGDITASSESISTVTDTMMDIHSDEYPELQKIRQEMVELNNNITGLVSSIVRNGGTFTGVDSSSIGSAESAWMSSIQKASDALFNTQSKAVNITNMFLLGLPQVIAKYVGGALAEGIFGGSTKTWNTEAGLQLADTSIGSLMSGGGIDVNTYADYRTKKSGGWFGKTKWSDSSVTGEADADIQRLFDQVFLGLSETLMSLGESLGTPISQVKAFVFEVGKIDLKDLTGEEINQKLQDVISTAADNAAQSIFSGIEQYQKVGEGLYETAARLVTDKEIILASLDAIGVGFTGVANSMEAIRFSETLLTMAVDLETFTTNISGYFTAFFSEAEQTSWSVSQLSASMLNLGMIMPSTRDGFRDLVEAQDLSTDAGKSAFVALMSLVDAADAVYDASEKAAKELISISDWVDSLRSKWEPTNNLDIIGERYGLTREQMLNKDALTEAYNAFQADPQAVQDVADKFGVSVSQVESDMETLIDAILDGAKTIAAEAVDLAARMETIKSYGSFQLGLGGMSSSDISLTQMGQEYKWGGGYGSAGKWDMAALYKDGVKPFLDMTFADFEKFADVLGMTAPELMGEVNTLNDALASLSETAEQSRDMFSDLSDSLRDQILGMQTSSDNQADIFERLGIQKGAISDMLGGQSIGGYLGGLGSDAEKALAIQKLQDLYGGQLTLSQEAYERPSSAYQGEYSTVLGGLNELLAYSDLMKSEYQLQYEQTDYLKIIAENTSGLSDIPKYDEGGWTGSGGLAILHPNEVVLNPSQQAALTTQNDSGATVYITINAYGDSSDEVARNAVSELERRLPALLSRGPARVAVQTVSRGR
jgi:tape measure domain-containing protein